MDLAQRSSPSYPKCGRPVDPGAAEYSACGVVLSKAHAPGSRAPAEAEPDGVWRSGALLVMRRGARLPERCIRCGALLLVSVAVCGAGVITTGLAVQIAVAKRIDDEHLWIEKLGPRFLARLPEAPEALRGV